jgi:hypothetical protein
MLCIFDVSLLRRILNMKRISKYNYILAQRCFTLLILQGPTQRPGISLLRLCSDVTSDLELLVQSPEEGYIEAPRAPTPK